MFFVPAMNKSAIKTNYLFLGMLSLWILGSACQPQEENEDQKAKIALREVGHQLLLATADSTSTIPPIKALENNSYLLSFSNDLSIEPQLLVDQMKDKMQRAGFERNYTVEVKNCEDLEVAYSYEIAKEEQRTIIPCGTRILPPGCYKIQLFISPSKQKAVTIPWWWLTIPVLLIGVFLFYFKPNNSSKKEESKNFKSLGDFRFYPDQNKLVKAAVEIGLSNKECELLAILVETPNQIIRREELLKRVWEDNGVVTGRSLDTYISKLRKKLKDDDRIQIVNVHGVGYKLSFNSK
ncbi:winged helix-turn-helix domain-containing protein [Gilvibacter sp.]|uniref:winged helix-turn-helix domain-containing protein n=1 Tax=Gilvibacter sp. TaxID=2729997 RepID=UPI0025BE5DBD|nr:winged helix-turn-helix domain-containing protein [Gilvibacter sp.]NQX78585.1 winged helix-turn-helix transcriptional regulator [Gilvibacter sp.]